MSSKLTRLLAAPLLVTFGFWAFDPGTTHAVIGGKASIRGGGAGRRGGGASGGMRTGGMRAPAPKSIGAGKGTVKAKTGSGKSLTGGITSGKPSDGDSTGGKKAAKK